MVHTKEKTSAISKQLEQEALASKSLFRFENNIFDIMTHAILYNTE